ncbi:MAG: hypothetical protein HYX48_07345 [Chlamydiales bacterium]|nr:hypothetical protein [Chlamydiales bacterium]
MRAHFSSSRSESMAAFEIAVNPQHWQAAVEKELPTMEKAAQMESRIRDLDLTAASEMRAPIAENIFGIAKSSAEKTKSFITGRTHLTAAHHLDSSIVSTSERKLKEVSRSTQAAAQAALSRSSIEAKVLAGRSSLEVPAGTRELDNLFARAHG